MWKNWGVRPWGSISGFVPTQTMTLGESLANSGKPQNNSRSEYVPALSPHVQERPRAGEGTVAYKGEGHRALDGSGRAF